MSDTGQEGNGLWTVPLCDVDGTLMVSSATSDFIPRHVRGIRTFPLTKDDVLMVEYAKSGIECLFNIS